MESEQKRARNTWTTRINLEDEARDLIRALATRRCVSTATMLGTIIESYVYVTARSTT